MSVRSLLLVAAKQVGDLSVRLRHAGLPIGDEQDRVGILNGGQSLVLDLIDEVRRSNRENALAAMRWIDAPDPDLFIRQLDELGKSLIFPNN